MMQEGTRGGFGVLNTALKLKLGFNDSSPDE
jgi:hypothetical protein